jgi:hypothetical protein
MNVPVIIGLKRNSGKQLSTRTTMDMKVKRFSALRLSLRAQAPATPVLNNATVKHEKDSYGRWVWVWTKNIQNKNSACETYETKPFIMRHTCPSEVAENCGVTPSWDGTCPYPSYPNNGMCCSGCNGAAAAPGRTSIQAATDIA